MDRISEPKNEKVYLFNSPDVAKILMYEQKLSNLFHLVISNAKNTNI